MIFDVLLGYVTQMGNNAWVTIQDGEFIPHLAAAFSYIFTKTAIMKMTYFEKQVVFEYTLDWDGEEFCEMKFIVLFRMHLTSLKQVVERDTSRSAITFT